MFQHNDTVMDVYTGHLCRVVIEDDTGALDPGLVEVEEEVTGMMYTGHRVCFEPAFGPRRDVGWGRRWW